MTILRVHKKQNNFVILDKTCLTDEKLSWGAKGLHAFLISMPDDWSVQVSHLQKCSTNGRDAVRGFLSELQKAGYIKRSAKRDDDSGRFGGFEYLVLETPESDLETKSPATGNPSSVEKAQLPPATENPATGNPAPVNPPLINNNIINNKKLNNKTAAKQTEQEIRQVEKNAAAVSFSPINQNQNKTNQIQLLSKDDALIADKLTLSQHKRINALVNSLNISEKETLKKEIEFCLLNQKHFTACGADFSKKLNAIRNVILRGDWQTPAGMISKPKKGEVSQTSDLKDDLRVAYAELAHFKRMQENLSDSSVANFEPIISQVKNKIKDIENNLAQIETLQTA